MKKVKAIVRPAAPHWVGNGFPVQTIFSYDRFAEALSPFLLLDYAKSTEFPGDGVKRGVGEHPHRGFETVTIVYEGELAHKDSSGEGGIIRAGDVQWMTAGAGILHEEFHSTRFSQQGGPLQMVQLWVNLPRQHKMMQPRYQAIEKADIPVVLLPDDVGTLRVIAGNYEGTAGSAETVSPLNVFDVQLKPGGQMRLDIPEGWNNAVIVLDGSVRVNGSASLKPSTMALLEREGGEVVLHAEHQSQILILSGEPIDEPVVGHGPFVMNSAQEISQAFADYSQGRFASE
ncbi:pirin family protein [Idiomarina sp. ST10R2A5]|uniref:pirin family protein n=1 Tax=Idiomarina sp. ST10R2A5 TaxID=3418368 RepID=UPI003EC73AEA